MNRASARFFFTQTADFRSGQVISTTILYLAAPLFSVAERRFNRDLADALIARLDGIDIILPQNNKPDEDAEPIDMMQWHYDQCIAGLARADIVLAILDGPDADSGVCFETGWAKARGKPVIGIRTDFRDQQEFGVNLMLSRGVDALIHRTDLDESIDALADRIGECINNHRFLTRK